MKLQTLLGVVLLVLSASVVRAAEDVKLLAGFEWGEYAPRVGRSMVLGEPKKGAAEPGFRATRYASLKEVGDGGFQVFSPRSSRDHPGHWMTREHATQGDFAQHFLPRTIEMGSWSRLVTVVSGKWKHPFSSRTPGYDPIDWYYQRFCHVWQMNWKQTADFSAYDRLRFDVHAVAQPIVLGVRIRDGVGPRINAGPTGVKTALGLFTVPADETVTCEFPMAAYAAAGEVDLSKVHRVFIRLNGLPSKTAPKDLFLDNIRLIRKGAQEKTTLRILPAEGEPRPHVRPVFAEPPTVRDAGKRTRRVGPVEPLGPVVINNAALYITGVGHLVGPGHFGGSGATYFRSARRGVVAYDNDRLCVVMSGRSKYRGGRGGLIALASFDGGRTWGGLTEADKDFTVLPWQLRAGVSADAFGDLYYLGTPNCDSYREGQDICMYRLAFTGTTWVADRFAILYQNGYKCPAFGRGWRLESGRIWMLWHDGFGGNFAKCSDDDGFTFKPCKDASLAVPRPFYEPTLGGGDPPPKQVVLYPADRVVGTVLVPYAGHVAAVGGKGYQVHDGAKWGPPLPGPKWLGDSRLLGGMSVTVLGERQLFIARSFRYGIRGADKPAPLQVARRTADGWQVDQLEAGGVGDSILTASGEAVYCFYVRLGEGKSEICYRRFEGGKWADAVTLAEEPGRVNRLASPITCPPDYAAILWDQRVDQRDRPSEVKFIRVPNR